MGVTAYQVTLLVFHVMGSITSHSRGLDVDCTTQRHADTEQQVIVSWDKDTAVVASWGVFCDYWDDFCYAASDDVSAFPVSFDWVLFYQHGERFVFGQKRVGAA